MKQKHPIKRCYSCQCYIHPATKMEGALCHKCFYGDMHPRFFKSLGIDPNEYKGMLGELIGTPYEDDCA